MKKILSNLLAMAAIASIALSCAKENTDPSAPEKPGMLRFSAQSGAVKTTVEPGEGNIRLVKWAQNDPIQIAWHGSSTTAYAQEAGTTTTVEIPDPGATVYWAAYPASSGSWDEENDALSITVPASQDGGFASSCIAVSKSPSQSTNLNFFNAVALVKFSVSGEDYTKAVFKGAKGETVAGKVPVTFTEEEEVVTGISLGEAEEPSTSVTVNFDGSGEYYFAVLPQTFEQGFSITLYKGEVADVPAAVRNPKVLDRATILDMGSVNGKGVTEYFATPEGAGKKTGKNWDNAFGAAQLKAFLEQPLDGTTQIDAEANYKAEILDGATIYMAEGDYYLAGEAGGRVKVEFTNYPKQVEITFKGGYPAGLTGTDKTGREEPAGTEAEPSQCTAFTGNAEAGIFLFGNQTSISFEGITFKNASFSTANGAIRAEAGGTGDTNISLSHCRVINNTNTDSQTGAGIYLSKASATIDHCFFGGNHARNGACINLNTGEGTVAITNCLFKGNTTFNTSGALQNGSVKTVTVSDCVFENNTAGSYGGGAFHINASGASSTFTDCVFRNNSASKGGAVSVQVGTATFTDCTFENNSATEGSKKNAGDGDEDVLAAFAGGAIILHNANSVCNLNHCTFTGNSAPKGSGGAIAYENVAATLNINAGTSFSGNTAYNLGGTIFVRGAGKLNINGTSESKVTFTGDHTLATGNAHANGGAIWLGASSQTVINYAVFDGCEAGQEAGSTVNYSNGGAVRITGVKSIQVNNSEFTHCRARNGMCISLEMGGSSTCKFTDCNFHDNIGRSGASKTGTGGNFHGGVAQLGAGTVQFERCAFTDNVAYHGSGAVHQNGANTTLKCTDCTFTNNSAVNGNGGCVTVESTGSVNLDGCTFTNNSVAATSTTRRDGGVFSFNVAGSSLTATGCTFTGNKITGSGDKTPYGGVFRVAYNTALTFKDCVFDGNGNSVLYSGGCISLNQDAVLKMDGCLFKNNVSKTRGAAIQAGANALVYLNNVAFYNNTTTGGGGWGVNVHTGNANVCMNNVSSYNNHCTAASPGNCVSFTGDGGWLVVNSTLIDNTPTAVVRRGGSNGRYAIFCNNVLINTNTANNTWAMNEATKFSSMGHNVVSTSGTYNNAAPAASDLLSQTSLPGGSYSEHWNATPHYAVYTWTGSLAGFSPAEEADVTAAFEAYTETDTVHTAIKSIGADFKSWLESLGESGSYGYQVDGRGTTRTGTWWPGAYQNN